MTGLWTSQGTHQASPAGRQAGDGSNAMITETTQTRADLLTGACRSVANRLGLHLVPITLQLGRLSWCYDERGVGLALQCSRAGNGIGGFDGVKVCGMLLFEVLEVEDDLLHAVAEDHQVPAGERGIGKRH